MFAVSLFCLELHKIFHFYIFPDSKNVQGFKFLFGLQNLSTFFHKKISMSVLLFLFSFLFNYLSVFLSTIISSVNNFYGIWKCSYFFKFVHFSRFWSGFKIIIRNTEKDKYFKICSVLFKKCSKIQKRLNFESVCFFNFVHKSKKCLRISKYDLVFKTVHKWKNVHVSKFVRISKHVLLII